MKLIFSLSLLTVVFCDQYLDFRLIEPEAATPLNCTVPGPFCETCSSLVACIQNSDDSWTKTPLATCKAPSYCVGGACTSDYDPICSGVADLNFPCTSVGTFPDPFYCNKFNICIKDESVFHVYRYDCPVGFEFNLTNDLCDIVLGNGECPDRYRIPLCTDAGQSESLPEKPAMYYICETRTVGTVSGLYPYLYVCPGNQIYENYECTNTTITTGTPYTTTPTPTTTLGP